MMKLSIFAVIAILLFGLATVGSTQDAKVIILDAQDSKKAAKLYMEKQAANDAWHNFNVDMVEKYAKGDGFTPDVWTYGVRYSSDFRAMIPAKEPESQHPFIGINSCAFQATGCYISDVVPDKLRTEALELNK